MYLEKLEIQGFKSFANKNTLKFVAAEKGKIKELGITAVVGPNGSGKSNIADAIRWVLGEQSVKLLRGKKSEDVIFSGSNKKSALSFAEVSLFLNNEDKRAPIDFSDVVVTRRLYRDGESEYLLNGSRVRLLDISLLLAKARFGQRAYSVIGQGMVENFLNTTLAERKEFFDEATGVKMYQLKRDDAMNKLQTTRGNLAQAANLLSEIEPRMHSLTRQMKRLEQRAETEEKLQSLQKNYYAGQWHKLNDELKKINQDLLSREKLNREEEKEVQKINQELDQRQVSQYGQEERQKLGIIKRELEAKRNDLFQKLSDLKARASVSLERAGKIDAAWLIKREAALGPEIDAGEAEIRNEESKLAEIKKELQAVKEEQERVNKNLIELRTQTAVGKDKHDDAILVKKTRNRIDELINLHQHIFVCLEQGDDWATAKKHLAELRAILAELKEELKDQKEDQATADSLIKEKAVKLETQKQNLLERFFNLKSQAQGKEDKIKFFNSVLTGKIKERAEIKNKLQAAPGGEENSGGLKKEEERASAELKKVSGDLAEIENKLEALQAAGRAEQEEFLRRQKLAHELQLNANNNAARLNEIKITKARVETKLEDLENEIRNETNNLRAVIDAAEFDSDLDKDSAAAEIQKLKRQLELIGGIDPEVKKEYEETKIRFDFLSRQTQDLDSGIISLEKIVAELDKSIAEKFDKAFADIAKHFEKYFKILFNGGGAKLLKIMADAQAEENGEDDDEDEIDEDDDDETESKSTKKIVLRQTKQILAGIEIQATPPGKKIRSISMLSGGERALTAIALICAIISVNPSPFVVLDEVDAALDEANSGRLSNILEELSDKTQFIVITHNRSMMYKAGIIYGVTMGEDGVSQLLSLKVDEATAGSKK
ncbi:MAG: AAA family ATPase [Patescibacteria group bacterium]